MVCQAPACGPCSSPAVPRVPWHHGLRRGGPGMGACRAILDGMGWATSKCLGPFISKIGWHGWTRKVMETGSETTRYFFFGPKRILLCLWKRHFGANRRLGCLCSSGDQSWKYLKIQPGGTNGWSFSSVVSSEKHLQLSPFPGFALLSGTSIPYLFAMLVDFRGHGNIRGGFSTIKGVRSSWRQEVCSSEIEVVFHSTARGGSCITMDPQGAVPLMY